MAHERPPLLRCGARPVLSAETIRSFEGPVQCVVADRGSHVELTSTRRRSLCGLGYELSGTVDGSRHHSLRTVFGQVSTRHCISKLLENEGDVGSWYDV